MDEASEGEPLWRLTLEHSPVGMALVSTDGDLRAVNRAFSQMLGYRPSELRSKNFREITHPDDLEADVQLFGEALAGKRTSYRMRKRYFHRDGGVVWGDLSVALLRSESGRPIHFIAQVLDISAEKEAERQLAEANAVIEHQRRTQQAIYDSVDVGLLLIDAEGHYAGMNRRHHDFMALAFPEGHLGQAGQLGDVYAQDGVTVLRREQMPTHRAAQGEEYDDLRIWVGKDPDARRALSVSARTVFDARGRYAGAALAYTDVTDLMRALTVKDEFVASVSHELRTPLTSVLGHLELLVDRDDLPADVHERLAVVQRNATRLRQLVSDLLEVAQGDRRGITVVKEPADIAAILRASVEGLQPTATAGGLELVVESPEEMVTVVDGERIRQVLDNLLGNAVKYTEPGGRVSVALRPLPAEHVLELEISDTGIGIDDDELDSLFHRFFRGREAQHRMTQGTGLGLSIVRAIVDAHDGEIVVRSRAGEGSTFRVRLPLEPRTVS